MAVALHKFAKHYLDAKINKALRSRPASVPEFNLVPRQTVYV
jgi:hypothetical protein